VEQNAEVALARRTVDTSLVNGRISVAGSAKELRGSDLVKEAFLGTKRATPSRSRDQNL
jgi:ABC-type branched-subunit amino acid transport system ATPase component